MAYSTPGRIRTPNLLVRSQTLYPIELRAHKLILFCVAGVQGIEPRPSEPEPDVLPLDDTPMISLKKGQKFNQFPLRAKRIKVKYHLKSNSAT